MAGWVLIGFAHSLRPAACLRAAKPSATLGMSTPRSTRSVPSHLQAVLPIAGVFSATVSDTCMGYCFSLCQLPLLHHIMLRILLTMSPTNIIPRCTTMLQGIICATVLMVVIALANVYTNDILLWQAHAVRRADYETLSEVRSMNADHLSESLDWSDDVWKCVRNAPAGCWRSDLEGAAGSAP